MVTGRRCLKCREIQTIGESPLMWVTRQHCERCDYYCALEGSLFCAQCKLNAEVRHGAKDADLD